MRSVQQSIPRVLAIGVGFLLACWQLVGSVGAVDAQRLVWSEPVRVSSPIANQFDWFPNIAADDQGNVHIVWNSTPGDEGTNMTAAAADATGQLAYVRWNGTTWTDQSDIALIWYGYPARNSLVVDRDGRLHLIYKGWSDPSAHKGQDLWSMSADGERAETYSAWTTPIRVNSGPLPYFVVVRLDNQGKLHAVWTENDPSGKYSLYYANSSDGGSTWSRRLTIEDSEPVWWYRAQLVMDAHDNLYVTYELGGQDKTATGLGFGTSRGSVLAESDDGGLTWTKHLFGGTPGNSASPTFEMLAPGPQQPAIGIDGEQNRLFVFREFSTNRILFRESADGDHWSEPQPVAGIKSGVARPYDVYDLATDSAGHVHLVASGYPTGSNALSLLHSEWNGQNWSRAEIITSGAPYPEYPRLAIGQGNRLHVVWFGGDKPSVDRTPNGIWYSTALTDASERLGLIGAAPRVAGAAPVAALVPTVTTVAIPTPMSLPEAARVTYDGGRKPGIDSLIDQPVVPVLVALLIAGAFLATIVGVQLRRMRVLKPE